MPASCRIRGGARGGTARVGPCRGRHGYHCAGVGRRTNRPVSVPRPRILGAFRAGGGVATAGLRSDHARRGPLASHARPDQLLPGDRARTAPGRVRAVPDLEPRPRGRRTAACSAGTSTRTTSTSSPSWSRCTWRPRSCCSGFFWQDWVRIVSGIGRSLRDREISDSDARLGWLLVVGTIPAGILGLALENPLRKLFASADLGRLLHVRQRAAAVRRRAPARAAPRAPRRRSPTRTTGSPTRVSWRQSVGVGASQALALIPGISRSGVTMGGGLLVGLNNQDAAKFGVPARHADHRRRGAAQDPRAARQRRATASAARRSWPRSAPRSPPTCLGPLPDALLRDQPADPVCDLLHRRRSRC